MSNPNQPWRPGVPRQQNQQPQGPFNPFRGIKDAPNQQTGGSYIQSVGEGIVIVEECKWVESQNPQNRGAIMFIANLVIESWRPSDGKDMAPGAKRDWIANLAKQAAWADLKVFTAVALDIPTEEVDEDILGAVVGPDQIAKGSRLALQTILKKTRAGGDFMLHKWSPPVVPQDHYVGRGYDNDIPF